MVFRGHADSGYSLHSSLYRSLLDSTKDKEVIFQQDTVEKALTNAENKALKIADKYGIVRDLNPLERLTLLQHHGTPTRLIDVTSDWRVALFFPA